MFLRLQILDTETQTTVAAVIVPPHVVTAETARQWAEALAQDADKRAGVAGLHTVLNAEHIATMEKAAKGLRGSLPGMGGNRTGPKPRGRCAVCGGEYPLNKTGVIALHGKPYGKGYSKQRCAGSKKAPSAKVNT